MKRFILRSLIGEASGVYDESPWGRHLNSMLVKVLLGERESIIAAILWPKYSRRRRRVTSAAI